MSSRTRAQSSLGFLIAKQGQGHYKVTYSSVMGSGRVGTQLRALRMANECGLKLIADEAPPGSSQAHRYHGTRAGHSSALPSGKMGLICVYFFSL